MLVCMFYRIVIKGTPISNSGFKRYLLLLIIFKYYFTNRSNVFPSFKTLIRIINNFLLMPIHSPDICINFYTHNNPTRFRYLLNDVQTQATLTAVQTKIKSRYSEILCKHSLSFKNYGKRNKETFISLMREDL